MIEFMLYVLSTVGFSHILVDGSIFSWLRDAFDHFTPKYFSKMIHCHMCTGFWTGMTCGVTFLGYNGIFNTLGLGFAGSFLSHFANFILVYIDTKTFESMNAIHMEDDDDE